MTCSEEDISMLEGNLKVEASSVVIDATEVQ